MLKETWQGNREYQLANNGQGMCNTKRDVFAPICDLGGIGCDVDHKYVMIHNILQEVKAPSWAWAGST